MFIAKAYAQATESLAELGGEVPPLPDAPGASELIMQNLMVVGVLVFLFYILLIMPQQKRFKEHNKMLNALKKGDKVVTGGGLIGTVEKVIEDKDEIVINLGDIKVTALRSTIHQKDDPRLRDKKPSAKEMADTVEKAEKTESPKKAEPAKAAKTSTGKAAAKSTKAAPKTGAKKTAAKKTSK